MEDRLLQHSKSDESLFDDLRHVIDAPKKLLSHLVGSRTKEDRAELQRILTHLPIVRECRSARTSGKFAKSGTSETGQKPVEALVEEQPTTKVATPRAVTPLAVVTPRAVTAPAVAAPRAVTPLVATPRAVTPLMGTAVSPKAPLPPPATPPSGPPSVGGGFPVQPPPTPPVVARGSRPNTTPRAGSRVGTPRVATRVSSRGATPRGQIPRRADTAPLPATTLNNTPPEATDIAAELAAAKKATELSAVQAQKKPEEEKKAQGEATQRVIQKLAELGIDPEGMTATDILRIFYARGSGSSYWLANREAEKRLSLLNIRASTPKSFNGVLKPRAEREIRRARDLPVTNVHEYLDQWEIAFLGDVCRSLRCFDEAAEGFTSEYMRKYTNRQYGAQSGRKKYNRPPT